MSKDPDFFLFTEAARSAIANAREFEQQATLLLERGWSGRAMALAILGQEELGKAYWLSNIAIGFFPAHPDLISAIRRRHWSKQMMSYALDALIEVVNRVSRLPEFELLEAANREALQGAEDASDPAAAVESLRQIRGVGQEPFLAAFRELAVRLPPEFEAIHAGATDRAKQRGFYVDVDLDAGAISSPGSVNAAEAQLHLTRLRTVLAVQSEVILLAHTPAQLEQIRSSVVSQLKRPPVRGT